MKQNDQRKTRYSDPYDVLSDLLDLIDKDGLFVRGGKIDVETWLTPFPLHLDMILMNTLSFVSFIDAEGCREYYAKVAELAKKILPEIPFLVGVDHSLSGGLLKALSERYGKSDILTIFVDSHFDAIQTPTRCDLIHYDIETNPHTRFDANDLYLHNRLNSYNAESFIRFLVQDEVLLPENIVCIGVSNYPPSEAFRSEDERLRKYVEQFTSLERRGLKIVRKEDLRSRPNILESIFKNYDLPYVSVSVDMDIGAKLACSGVRFSEYAGMQRSEILKIVEAIRTHALQRSSLIGLDLMEIDMHSADENTFTLGLMIVKELLRLK
jgi:arginase family enzyme